MRYVRDDAAARLAVPVGFAAGVLEELEELPQAAAASAMHVITSSTPMRARWFFPGITTIVRP